MAILTIGGTAVKAPSKFEVGMYDVSSKADRNAQGLAVIDRVARKRKIECEWNFLTNAQLATILSAAGKTTVFFTVAYFDPEDNAAKTITCYVGDRSMGVPKYSGDTPVGWARVKMNFIEQ